MPASMMANESSVRSAIAGFRSAKIVKLPKLGLSTVPSAVLHRHLLHQLLHLQSRGSFFQPTRFLQSVLIARRSVPPPSQHQLALVSAHPPPTSRTTKEKDRPPSPIASSSPQPPSAPQHSDPPSSAPAPSTGSESRRRNAEQRAAQLRADPLLAQVEPHRVFCALCRKWVQLRQDSTFCAYPWQQHRSKCVIRQSVASFFFLFMPSPIMFFVVLFAQ
jgi:hypothetical protein